MPQSFVDDTSLFNQGVLCKEQRRRSRKSNVQAFDGHTVLTHQVSSSSFEPAENSISQWPSWDRNARNMRDWACAVHSIPTLASDTIHTENDAKSLEAWRSTARPRSYTFSSERVPEQRHLYSHPRTQQTVRKGSAETASSPAQNSSAPRSPAKQRSKSSLILSLGSLLLNVNIPTKPASTKSPRQQEKHPTNPTGAHTMHTTGAKQNHSNRPDVKVVAPPTGRTTQILVSDEPLLTSANAPVPRGDLMQMRKRQASNHMARGVRLRHEHIETWRSDTLPANQSAKHYSVFPHDSVNVAFGLKDAHDYPKISPIMSDDYTTSLGSEWPSTQRSSTTSKSIRRSEATTERRSRSSVARERGTVNNPRSDSHNPVKKGSTSPGLVPHRSLSQRTKTRLRKPLEKPVFERHEPWSSLRSGHGSVSNDPRSRSIADGPFVSGYSVNPILWRPKPAPAEVWDPDTSSLNPWDSTSQIASRGRGNYRGGR